MLSLWSSLKFCHLVELTFCQIVFTSLDPYQIESICRQQNEHEYKNCFFLKVVKSPDCVARFNPVPHNPNFKRP